MANTIQAILPSIYAALDVVSKDLLNSSLRTKESAMFGPPTQDQAVARWIASLDTQKEEEAGITSFSLRFGLMVLKPENWGIINMKEMS